MREAAIECAQPIASKLNAESKVHSFDVHMSIKEHTFWLWVPGDDTLLVAVSRGRYQLLEDALGLILSHGAVVLQVIEHVPSTKVLRHED